MVNRHWPGTTWMNAGCSNARKLFRPLQKTGSELDGSDLLWQSIPHAQTNSREGLVTETTG